MPHVGIGGDSFGVICDLICLSVEICVNLYCLPIRLTHTPTLKNPLILIAILRRLGWL